MTVAQLRPLAIPIYEDAALVEHPIQQQRRSPLHPIQTSDVHSTARHRLEVDTQARVGGISGEGSE